MQQSIDQTDSRSRIIMEGEKMDQQLAIKKTADRVAAARAADPNSFVHSDRDPNMTKMALIITAAMVSIFLVSAGLAWVLYKLSERSSTMSGLWQ